MHSLLVRRIEMAEAWLRAFLFAFKLLTVFVGVWLLIWYALLPSNHTDYQTGTIDEAWYFAAFDFAMVAYSLSLLYFLAAVVLVIGGLIQFFEYSRRAAIWNIAFGGVALVIGIILMLFVPFPSRTIEILRSVA